MTSRAAPWIRRPFSVTRRNLLKALGVGSALAPFVPLLEADAQASAPKRVMFVYTFNGVVGDNQWEPSGSERNFELSEQLSPLEPWKDQLTILANAGMTSDFLQATSRSNHRGVPSMLFTGRPNVGGTAPGAANDNPRATGISIDQYLGPRLSSGLVFPTLNYSVNWHRNVVRNTFSYGPNAEYVQPEHNPIAAFDRAFGSLDPMGGAAEDPTRDQRSVLDVARQQLLSLQARVETIGGVENRRKMEDHLNGIREIEQSLSRLTTLDCSAPARPTGVDWDNTREIPATSRAFLDLAVEAMKCDLTRVVTLQWFLSTVVMTWLGHNGTQHDSSHRSDPTQMIESNQWTNGEVAYLLDRLAGVPEGSGTMLDNTLVLSTNDMGRNHRHDFLPFVFAGGGSHLSQGTGRYVRLNRKRGTGDVYTSICQIMGLDDEQFGDPELTEGAIPELL